MNFLLDIAIKVVVFIICYSLGAAFVNPFVRSFIALFAN